MIEEFLVEERLLKLAVVIVDGRHEPTILDQRMVQWLELKQIPAQVVATKIDKVSKSRRPKAVKVIQETLGVEKVIPFSAVTREGKKEIWRIIQDVC
jgi:GTP-binding protein